MKITFEIDASLVVVTSIAGAIALFVLHAVFPSMFGFWPSSSADLAAWVQAVGSVAAIVGTVWATKYQIRRAKEVEHIAEIQRTVQMGLSAYYVAKGGHHLVHKASLALQSGSQYSSYLTNTKTNLVNTIASADVVLAKNLDAEVLKNFLVVRSCMVIACSAIDLQLGDEPAGKAFILRDMAVALVNLTCARWGIRRAVRSAKKELQRLCPD